MGAARTVVDDVSEPDLYRPDGAGLRAWLAAFVQRGDLVGLVAWVVQFVIRLWDLQGQLRTRVQQAKRRQSPSERWRALQAELPGLFTPPANDAPAPTKPPPKTRRKRGAKPRHNHGRAPLPPELVREVRPSRVPADARTCPCCAEQMTRVDTEVTERLQRRVVYSVERTEREVLRCDRCQRGKVIAPAPDAIVDRGTLAEDLLIDATVDHYRDAVPFERKRCVSTRSGRTLWRSARWRADGREPLSPTRVALPRPAAAAR